jgi:hypothetical protein
MCTSVPVPALLVWRVTAWDALDYGPPKLSLFDRLIIQWERLIPYAHCPLETASVQSWVVARKYGDLLMVSSQMGGDILNTGLRSVFFFFFLAGLHLQ